MPQNQSILSEAINSFVQSRAAARAHLSPREREFERAGNGAGAVAAAIYLAGTGPVSADLGSVLCALLLLWGGWSFAVGVNRSRGQRDALAAGMALPAIAIGGAGLIFLPGHWLLNALWVYCLAGGLTMLALTMRGIRARGLPDPRRVPGMPISRPATRDEALRAMSDRNARFRPPRFRD